MGDAENGSTQVTSTHEVRGAAHLNIQCQAQIHTSFHGFMEIGQIFRNKKYILLFKFTLGLNFISFFLKTHYNHTLPYPKTKGSNKI